MVKHRRWLVACVLGAALLLPSAASALDVDSVTKTVTDPAHDVVDEVNNAVEGVTGTGPGKQITDTVDPVLDKVKGPVKGIVDDIVGPVQEVTDPVIDDEVIDDVTDGVLGGGAAGTPRPGKQQSTAGRRSKTATETSGVDPRAAARRRTNRSDGTRAERTTTTVPVMARAAAARTPAPARPASVPEAIADASRTFAFPLAVAALILLFLAIQHRIDARDPKLAEGQDDEELSFA